MTIYEELSKLHLVTAAAQKAKSSLSPEDMPFNIEIARKMFVCAEDVGYVHISLHESVDLMQGIANLIEQLPTRTQPYARLLAIDGLGLTHILDMFR